MMGSYSREPPLNFPVIKDTLQHSEYGALVVFYPKNYSKNKQIFSSCTLSPWPVPLCPARFHVGETWCPRTIMAFLLCHTGPATCITSLHFSTTVIPFMLLFSRMKSAFYGFLAGIFGFAMRYSSHL